MAEMTVRELIYEKVSELRLQSSSRRMLTVYLGHEEYRNFISDPEIYKSLNLQDQELKFLSALILQVNSRNHIGFCWTDGVTRS